MTVPNNYARAATALHVITNLTVEKQSLMTRSWQVPQYERAHIRRRLQEIDIELAHAQDERRRARAGAPPAPHGYDPMGAVPRVERGESEGTRGRSWRQKVEEIRADYQAGAGLDKDALSEKYNLSLQQIRRVLNENDAERSHPTAKLNEDQVRDILQRYQDSNGRRGIIKELADVFHVRKSTICDIIARRTWRNIDFEISVPRKRTMTRSQRTESEQVRAVGE